MMCKLSVLTGSFNCQWLRGKNRHTVHPCWEPIEVWHAVHVGICNMWFYGASSAEDKSTCHETGKADVKSNGRFLHANLCSICHHLALLRYMYMKTLRTGASSKSNMLAKHPKTILKKRYTWEWWKGVEKEFNKAYTRKYIKESRKRIFCSCFPQPYMDKDP